MEQKLLGKIALVTGSGRGLGRAMALALAEAGADLVVTARTKKEIGDGVAYQGIGKRGSLSGLRRYPKIFRQSRGREGPK